jgi:hypothetical protein
VPISSCFLFEGSHAFATSATKPDSSTLVLTTCEKRYVDVRVYISDPSDGPPNNPGGIQEFRGLEWAFAGTSESTAASYEPSSGALKAPAHTEWTHWVDSQTLDEVKDEGYMYPQPDGTVLEKGEMVRRETGKVTSYEEVWEDYDPEITGKDEKVAEVVLRCEDVRKGVKGVMARIGGWIQGVLRTGQDITVVRWQWVVIGVSSHVECERERSSQCAQVKEGEWKRIFATGSGVIPCEALFSGGGAYPQDVDMKVGIEVADECGMKWICVEALLW